MFLLADFRVKIEMMDAKTLSYFYTDDGKKKVFNKHYYIRVIRNRVIDPNTKQFLDYGFFFDSPKLVEQTRVPCDDSNFCEYMTFLEALKNGVAKLPFTMKLHRDIFYRIESLSELEELFKKVLEFRIMTVKKGWAIKYGAESEGVQYPLLEDLDEEELLEWKDPRANARYSMDDIKEKDLLA